METKHLARIAAIALVAVAITLTVLELREAPTLPPEPVAYVPAEPDADPLRAELRRCQALGAAAAQDESCLKAWAENRRRFLGLKER